MPELVIVSLLSWLPVPETLSVAVLVSAPLWTVSPPVRSAVPALVTVPAVMVVPFAVSVPPLSTWIVPLVLVI